MKTTFPAAILTRVEEKYPDYPPADQNQIDYFWLLAVDIFKLYCPLVWPEGARDFCQI